MLDKDAQEGILEQATNTIEDRLNAFKYIGKNCWEFGAAHHAAEDGDGIVFYVAFTGDHKVTLEEDGKIFFQAVPDYEHFPQKMLEDIAEYCEFKLEKRDSSISLIREYDMDFTSDIGNITQTDMLLDQLADALEDFAEDLTRFDVLVRFMEERG